MLKLNEINSVWALISNGREQINYQQYIIYKSYIFNSGTFYIHSILYINILYAKVYYIVYINNI